PGGLAPRGEQHPLAPAARFAGNPAVQREEVGTFVARRRTDVERVQVLPMDQVARSIKEGCAAGERVVTLWLVAADEAVPGVVLAPRLGVAEGVAEPRRLLRSRDHGVAGIFLPGREVGAGGQALHLVEVRPGELRDGRVEDV